MRRIFCDNSKRDLYLKLPLFATKAHGLYNLIYFYDCHIFRTIKVISIIVFLVILE